MAEPAYKQGEPQAVERLIEFMQTDNIAELLDEQDLNAIGARCLRKYKDDFESMTEIRQQMERGMKLAKQTIESKNEPWPGAANVKVPMIARGMFRFGSEAYSELIRGKEVCKINHPGLTPEGGNREIEARGQRVAKYLNYQLMDEMKEWDAETDKLLHALPGVGTVHRKTWYDPTLKRQESRMCLPDALTISSTAKSLDRDPVTEEIEFTSNEVYTRKCMGLWLDQEYQPENPGDDDKKYVFLEQHRWLDLDEDGYEEPYVVTFEKQSGKVARIAARYGADEVLIKTDKWAIPLSDFTPALKQFGQKALDEAGEIKIATIVAVQHFTKYSFIPSLDGGYWDMGYFQILGPMSESANTLINQLLDAGSLANAGGGIISQSLRLKEGGTVKVQLGKWHRASTAGKLGDAVFPWPVREPSNVLFLLLGVIREMAEELSVSGMMAGSEPSPNTPATTVLALIEQGKKVFSAIHKRIYRSLKSELGKLYRLNFIHADPAHYAVILNQEADPKADFNPDDMDVVPVASPELSSRYQQLAMATALRETIGMPGVAAEVVSRRYIEALGVENPEELVPEPSPEDMAKAATVQDIKEEILALEPELKRIEKEKLEAERDLARAKTVATNVDDDLKRAQTVKLLAEARALDMETEAASTGVKQLLEGLANAQPA